MFDYFLRNTEILPISEAHVPLDDIAYAYGFGVYETIRLTNYTLYFGESHVDRLIKSASAIGLEHTFEPGAVLQNINDVITANKAVSCNIKIMLIGGRSAADANLYIQCLRPLFPDRKLYKQGAHTVTVQLERAYPHAKTLNMLPSYLAYRSAQQAEAYDCLLIDRGGAITEGTRTNFYAVKGQEVISPPLAHILPGVTRDNVLRVAATSGFTVREAPILLRDIATYDGAFLTSTSSKIMPIRSIDTHTWDNIPETTKQLMDDFTTYLHDYAAQATRL
jgi:branched-chain amino acid aminotransferase